jgi:hypothetical protein
MGLLHHVRQSQVEQVAGLLRAMDEARDPVGVISALLRVSGRWGADGLSPSTAAAPRVLLVGRLAGEVSRGHPELRQCTPPRHRHING